MSEVKWIKIVVDIFDDEKILLIESMPDRDSIIVIWFKLLCLAGKQNNGGVFMLNDRIPYTDEMLSVIFRRPVNTVRLSLQAFENFGMIEIINDVITIPNWGKHQSLDQIEQKRGYMREYMRKKREKQKQIACNAECKTNSKTNSKTNVSVPEEEGEEERDIKKNIKKKVAKFQPPSVAEVEVYCKERGNNVDAQRFVDYYTANGWMVGKNPMKDWKAAVRTWERNSGSRTATSDRSHSSIDIDEVEAMLNALYT